MLPAWSQNDDRGAQWQQETPPPQDSDIKLQTQKLGAPNVVLFRQLQQKRYDDYDAKTKPIRNALTDAQLYLLSRHGELPDLQQISALGADVWLKWRTFDKTLNDEERQYRSYQAMKTAAYELQHLSDYWIKANATRAVYRGTQKDMDTDVAILKQKQSKIENTLNKLDELEQIKRNLDDELPN